MDSTRTQIQLSHRAALDEDLVLTTTAYRHDLHRAWRKVNSFRGAAISDVLANPGSPTNAVFFAVLTGAAPPSSDEETLLIGPNDRTFVSEGIQFVVTHRPKTGPLSHRLEWAVRLHHDGVRRVHTEDGFLVDGTRLVPERTPTATTQDNEAESWALSMHAIDAVT
jgi:Fe(3+) dicitrate transport protein